MRDSCTAFLVVSDDISFKGKQKAELGFRLTSVQRVPLQVTELRYHHFKDQFIRSSAITQLNRSGC